MTETTTISARIYKSQLKEIKRLARKEGVDKSDALRKLLDEGLRQQRIREALRLVREGKVTVWKAAETAGVSYRTMLKALRSENVPFPLTAESLRAELGELLEGSE